MSMFCRSKRTELAWRMKIIGLLGSLQIFFFLVLLLSSLIRVTWKVFFAKSMSLKLWLICMLFMIWETWENQQLGWVSSRPHTELAHERSCLLQLWTCRISMPKSSGRFGINRVPADCSYVFLKLVSIYLTLTQWCSVSNGVSPNALLSPCPLEARSFLKTYWIIAN